MSVPGSNLLSQALTVIVSQTITYYKWNTRTVNEVGQYVSTYDAPIDIRGSFQPVPKSLYTAYGLDLQKEYYTFFTLNDLLDINRDVSNDQIVFNGIRFQCESDVEWFAVDKWKAVLCCKLKLEGAP
jgi:hypothetical protein